MAVLTPTHKTPLTHPTPLSPPLAATCDNAHPKNSTKPRSRTTRRRRHHLLRLCFLIPNDLCLHFFGGGDVNYGEERRSAPKGRVAHR